MFALFLAFLRRLVFKLTTPTGQTGRQMDGQGGPIMWPIRMHSRHVETWTVSPKEYLIVVAEVEGNVFPCVHLYFCLLVWKFAERVTNRFR